MESINANLHNLSTFLHDHLPILLPMVNVNKLVTVLSFALRRFLINLEHNHIPLNHYQSTPNCNNMATFFDQITDILIDYAFTSPLARQLWRETLIELMDSLLPYFALYSFYKVNLSFGNMLNLLVRNGFKQLSTTPLVEQRLDIISVLLKLLHQNAQRGVQNTVLTFPKMYGAILKSLLMEQFAELSMANADLDRLLFECFEPFEFYSGKDYIHL